MKKTFGVLPSGQECSLYTISCGQLTSTITDYGASLVHLFVPGKDGVADVCLGFDDCNGYANGSGSCLGATVGRNANRIQGAAFCLGGKEYKMTPNEGKNNLHSGPDLYLAGLDTGSPDRDFRHAESAQPGRRPGFPGKCGHSGDLFPG